MPLETPEPWKEGCPLLTLWEAIDILKEIKGSRILPNVDETISRIIKSAAIVDSIIIHMKEDLP